MPTMWCSYFWEQLQILVSTAFSQLLPVNVTTFDKRLFNWLQSRGIANKAANFALRPRVRLVCMEIYWWYAFNWFYQFNELISVENFQTFLKSNWSFWRYQIEIYVLLGNGIFFFDIRRCTKTIKIKRLTSKHYNRAFIWSAFNLTRILNFCVDVSSTVRIMFFYDEIHTLTWMSDWQCI